MSDKVLHAVKLLRADSHTAWLLDVFNWISLLLLLLCLTPCVLRVWRTAQVSKGFYLGWAGLVAWFIWEATLSPLVAEWWTGNEDIALAFPSSWRNDGPYFSVMLTAFLPSIILCSLILLVRRGFDYLQPKK